MGKQRISEAFVSIPQDSCIRPVGLYSPTVQGININRPGTSAPKQKEEAPMEQRQGRAEHQ